MFEQWTMPPFKVTLRKLTYYDGGDIYELITGSDRFGHDVTEVDGSIALILGEKEARKRFEQEKQKIMVRVAKIAMGLA